MHRRTQVAVVVLTAVLALLSLNPVPVDASSRIASPAPSTAAEQRVGSDVVWWINKERAARGLSPLRVINDANLSTLAAQRMRDNGQVRSYAFDEIRAWLRAGKANPSLGRPDSISGEAKARATTPFDAVAAMMLSDFARQSLLSENADVVAVGLACTSTGTFYVSVNPYRSTATVKAQGRGQTWSGATPRVSTSLQGVTSTELAAHKDGCIATPPAAQPVRPPPPVFLPIAVPVPAEPIPSPPVPSPPIPSAPAPSSTVPSRPVAPITTRDACAAWPWLDADRPLDDSVTRLYRAGFGRSPDPSGLSYWISQAAGGMGQATMAATFLDSSEGRGRYGSAIAAGDWPLFVNSVYTNVLDRAPEAGGLSYWSQEIWSGRLAPNEVLALIAASPENVARTSTSAPQGPDAGLLARLYEATYSAQPDCAGAQFWLTSGSSREAMVAAFVESPDFKARYGGTDTQFVTALFIEMIGRVPDVSGGSYWISQLSSGAMTRSDLVAVFIQNPAYIASTGTTS